MKDPLATTYELHIRSKDYGWNCWNTLNLLNDAQEQQQAWNNINKEARIVEVTRRVI